MFIYPPCSTIRSDAGAKLDCKAASLALKETATHANRNLVPLYFHAELNFCCFCDHYLYLA